MATGVGDIEIVAVTLGFSRFEAGVIAEACRDKGLTVELLEMDDHGGAPGTHAVLPRLLVRSDELAEAQRIMARSGYGPHAR